MACKLSHTFAPHNNYCNCYNIAHLTYVNGNPNFFSNRLHIKILAARRQEYIYIYKHVSNIHRNIHRITSTSEYTEVNNILSANMYNNSIVFVDVNEMSDQMS